MHTQRKSTTHEELFFQIKEPFVNNGREYSRATVFFRNEGSVASPLWFGSVAKCSANDQFCKKVGRSLARRRYFNSIEKDANAVFGPLHEKPTYDNALALYHEG